MRHVRITRLFILALMTLVSSGCNFFGVQAVDEPARILVSPEHVTLYVSADQGDEERFPSSAPMSAQVLGTTGSPLAGSTAEVRWAVSESTIATVDASGRLSAVATGSTILVSTSAIRPSVQATVSVTVLDEGHADVVVR